MRKSLATILLFFLYSFFLEALPSQNIREYQLENGLEIFALEDNSTPLVRIEFAVRAGFSSQTKDTAGYFKLFSRLISRNAIAHSPSIEFSDIQCNADSSRYIISCTAPETEIMFSSLADIFYDSDFSDEALTSEFITLQKEVKKNIDDLSGFLNAAVDSRVFSSAPWKHDSGIYAPLFSKIQKSALRSVINTIKNKWYTPQNSAIFISGNIKKEEILSLAQAYFGDYYFPAPKPDKKIEKNLPAGKKFVIHDADFSKDMTQIVIQYVNHNAEHCDAAAVAFSSDYSAFKNSLLGLEELNIPGYEYIDATSVQNENCSRLIIQSIMEASAEKKSKITSAEQANLFVQTVKEAFYNLSPEEFYLAKQNLISNMKEIEISSWAFMEKLSSFWAIEPYYKASETVFEKQTSNLSSSVTSVTANELLSRKTKITALIQNEFLQDFIDTEPFVFVIISSSDYKKNRLQYEKFGFEEITKDNAFWYNQPEFKESLNQDEEKLLDVPDDYQKAGNSIFYEANLQEIQKSNLTNTIPLTVKYSKDYSKMTLLLSIRGGLMHNATEPGLEEVMIHLLSVNIQNELNRNAERFTSFIPKIDYKTNMTSSYITAECAKEDFSECCSCICDAMVYGNESPALADRIVASKQYQKRLYNGSAVNQLYAGGINRLYPKSIFSKIFEAENDVLSGIQFQRIMNEYSSLLDASRYSLILSGDFPENAVEILNQSFGLLTARREKIFFPVYSAANLKNKRAVIKITHTFLTDIPAEEAPPMPAVLIPTTEFTDPMMYFYKSPDAKTPERARFNALMIYLNKLLQGEIENNKNIDSATASLMLPRSQMDTAVIIIQNAAHTKDADEALKASIKKLRAQLEGSDKKAETVLAKIKSEWTISKMSQTESDKGTAILIQKGLEFFPLENYTEFYLEEFKNVQEGSLADYIEALKFIEADSILNIYSKDSKK